MAGTPDYPGANSCPLTDNVSPGIQLSLAGATKIRSVWKTWAKLCCRQNRQISVNTDWHIFKRFIRVVFIRVCNIRIIMCVYKIFFRLFVIFVVHYE